MDGGGGGFGWFGGRFYNDTGPRVVCMWYMELLYDTLPLLLGIMK